MSLERSTLVAGIYGYLGDVADAPLPEGFPLQTVFRVLCEIEDEMLRDLDLSDQNRRVTFAQINLNSTTFSVNKPDFAAPAYVFLRTDPTSTVWYPVEIVNHAALNQASWDGRLAVSFYDTPQRAEVSWEPEAGQTLKIWYDKSGDDSPLLGEETDIGSLYDSYLKLQAAAQCRELMNLPVGDVLTARLVKSEMQWKRHVNQSRAQGTVEKQPCFLPSRFRRRSVLDPRRYYLP